MAPAKPLFRSSSSVVKQVVEEEEKKKGWGGGEWAKPPIPKSSSVVEQFLEEKKKKRGGSVVEEKTKLGSPIVLALPAVERTTIDESSHLMFKKPPPPPPPLLEKNKPRNESGGHVMIKKPPPGTLAGHKRKNHAGNSQFSDDEAVREFLAATERSMSRHGLIVGPKKPKPSWSSSDQVCHRPSVRVRIRRYDGPCKIVNVFITDQMHQFIREGIRDLTTKQHRAPT